MQFWIESHPEQINLFSEDIAVEGQHFILENNTFLFNKQFYLQTKGTAKELKLHQPMQHVLFSLQKTNV